MLRTTAAHLTLAAALALCACDGDDHRPAPEPATATPASATPARAALALTSAYDLTFTVRSSDGRGQGRVHVLDEASGSLLGACDAGTCVVRVAPNTRLSLVATPAAGSAFSGWQAVCWGRAADACEVDMSWHLTAGADFTAAPPPPAPATWDLTIAPRSLDGIGAGGARVYDAAGQRLGACGREGCVVKVPRGARVHVVATPEEGSDFGAWQNVCYQRPRDGCDLTVSWHTTVWLTFAAGPHHGESRDAMRERLAGEARALLEPERGRVLAAVFAPYAAEVERDGDDDPAPRVTLRTRVGDERVTLMGRGFAQIEAARSLTTARDGHARREVYRQLYTAASDRGLDVAGPFPDPAVVAADPVVVSDAIEALSTHIDQHLVPAKALAVDPIRIRACLEGDIGDEVGTDQLLDLGPVALVSWESCLPSNDGLYTAYDGFPRDSLTCVKAQGRRGTCAAFAVASALEAAIHQRWGYKTNLSEQHLYANIMGSSLSDHEGSSPWRYTKYLALHGLRAGYEEVWNYNGSRERAALTMAEYNAQEAEPRYWWKHSCINYFETCSDAVAQGLLECVTSDGKTSCDMTLPELTGTTYGLTQEVLDLWNPDDVDESLVHVRAKLLLEHQLVVSMALPTTFAQPDANGFVAMPSAAEAEVVLGHHAMHVVGYITNLDLAEILPGQAPGAGGGYFIIKNSSGPCFGDGGYVYLPHDLMKQYAYAMIGFTRYYLDVAP